MRKRGPSGVMMSKGNTEKKARKRPPKVRSYVRPTKVHTPKPRKKPKYPDKEIEEGNGAKPAWARERLDRQCPPFDLGTDAPSSGQPD